jgi:hypothetical protein
MKKLRLTTIIVFCSIAYTLFNTHQSNAINKQEQCFSQTGYCLDEPFLSYWKTNGGLPVFGYPITNASKEVNADTGNTYLTQWAERNRFEVHPENKGTPYEILLGLLGKQRLIQLNRDVDLREGGPKAGCLWFEETGHNVCDQSNRLGFKTYWESHGLRIQGLDIYNQSLQLFGFPLTEPKIETNANGDRVLTQWFERARFEWHAGNPDEFKVLLGLLAKEIRATQPQPTQPQPTQPQPTVTIEPTSTKTPQVNPTKTPRPSPSPTPVPSPTSLPTPIPTPTIPPYPWFYSYVYPPTSSQK